MPLIKHKSLSKLAIFFIYEHAEVGNKTGLDVCIAELKHQNWFSTICQFLGPVTKAM
jgi:hypothetical protein